VIADDRRANPEAPLPGPPDPWAETEMPTPRDGPPWHMTEMIQAEPALAARILDRLLDNGTASGLAAAVRRHAGKGNPIAVIGCGTSEHGAMAVASMLHGSFPDGDISSLQAFEASLAPLSSGEGLLIAVSHEGATWATMRALAAARNAGMTTALVTVSRRSPAAGLADMVLETHELDQSWCHTVGYISPIVAGLAVASAPGDAPSSDELRATLQAGLATESVRAVEAIARSLVDRDRIVVIGGGGDLIAARELVLKIEEGVHIPAAFRHLETLLHGHLAGMDDRTGMIAIGAHAREAGARARRIGQALAAAREIGVRAGAILTPPYARSIGEDLTPAGRVVIADEAPSIDATARSLLATAIPLQLLTERLARERGVNPDPIRRDDPRYLRAAEASAAAD
jgi:glucosamine--fructose-6-phosphate aminotransferase (isomerizing)